MDVICFRAIMYFLRLFSVTNSLFVHLIINDYLPVVLVRYRFSIVSFMVFFPMCSYPDLGSPLGIL